MLAAKYFVLWYSGACPHKPNIAVAENEWNCVNKSLPTQKNILLTQLYILYCLMLEEENLYVRASVNFLFR
jgi:hypothetical protein